MTSARSVDCSLCSNFANFTELPSYIEVRLHLDNLERSDTWLDLRQTSHGGSLLVCLHSVTNPASHIAMAGKFPGGETQMLSRFNKSVLPALAALITAAVATPAHAVLERVGPVNNSPQGGGFPAWYQDTSGLGLEFCGPAYQAELDGGWCLILPGDTVFPESFPTTFFDEHFFYAGDSALTPLSGGKALLRVAVEAAFTSDVAQGGQITFSRIRVKLTDIPVTGTYRFIHPYGEESIDAAAGEPRGIFFTDDIGIGAAGDFTGALNSRLWPFLAASATPGGAEMPPVPAANPTPDTDPAHFGGTFAATPYPGTGKAYLADPARVGPVTGSSLPDFTDSTGALRNHNIFRIEGPPGSNPGGPGIDVIETTGFSLMGRAFSDTVPGRVNVDRASYTASACAEKLGVFASGFETTAGGLRER